MAEKHRIRKKQIHLYVTEDEYKVLQDKSDYVGMNISQFIRNIILDDNIKKLPVDEIIEASKAINNYKFEINKIGNNINQLVKVIHENNDLYFEEQMQEAMSKIESVMNTFDELTKVMYEKLYDLE